MKKVSLHFLLLSSLLAGVLLALLGTLLAGAGRQAEAAHNPLGFGFNVAPWDVALVEEMGFDWMKVFNPPSERLPVNLLLRVDAHAQDLADVAAFGNRLATVAADQGDFIEAYEIGNEVNLGVDYGWDAPPVAADYVTLLCEAYARIKLADPMAVVVSAGLAPTGRIAGYWEGHAGHNGQNQDEREYLREFLAAGGAGCADAIGYHPHGFSADYDTPPDVISYTNPAANCENGFCFRGAEKIHEILVAQGEGEKPIWATEFGWIVEPPDYCLSDPSFEGRHWQLVSEERQAENLLGAFRYAQEHWPWMEAMFVFNLNFNADGWYAECDQIRYYAVQGRPAEAALRDDLAKEPARLAVEPVSFTLLAAAPSQPLTETVSFSVRNLGEAPLVYTVSIISGFDLIAAITPTQGAVPAGAEARVDVTLHSRERAPGVYTGTLLVAADPHAVGAPVTVTARLRLGDELYPLYLPSIRHQ